MSILISLLCLMACGTVEPIDTSAPALSYRVDELPSGGCGLRPYNLLSPEALGKIIDWEFVEEASYPASFYETLFLSEGLDAMTPVPYGVKTYRVRYLTQDKGEVVEATGVISFPDVDQPRSFPTALWMHPTMGLTNECGPSGSLEGILSVSIVAAYGYVTIAPDLLGMAGWGEPAHSLHPYIVPEPTALVALDALRAGFAFQEAGRGPEATGENRVVIWGTSEGGFSALWAERYADYYAPEFNIEAVVAGVPPTDLVGLARSAVSGRTDATEGMAAVLMASAVWYEDEAALRSLLTDEAPNFYASTIVSTFEESCRAGGYFSEVQEVRDLYQPSYVEALLADTLDSIEPFACYLRQGTLKDSTIPRVSDRPVLFTVGQSDTLITGAVERADASVLCERGYSLEYLECAGLDHVETGVQTLPYQIQWVKARLAGEPLTAVCEIGEPVDCSVFSLSE